MLKRIMPIIMFICLVIANNTGIVIAADSEPIYTQFRQVDKGTFNEFRYKITDSFFNFRNKYELDGKIDVQSAKLILDYARQGYNYLPDSLSNKNYYNYLKTAVERGILFPNNTSNYTAIQVAVENFLDKTTIQTIKGKVEAFPSTGNAPLTVTFRGSNIVDPTGTKIPTYNYTWWMYENGRRVILGSGLSISHVFKEEGTFSVFLDVSSAHKNEAGYTDVLPFSSRADVVVKEKIASIILKVNSVNLLNSELIKFTPEEAKYGLLFDATSSTPTSGAKFAKTTWNFGNGVIRENIGYPKVERVIYPREGDYTVTLTLQTNELKKVEKKFIISIHNPIATIKSNADEGFMGDKFTFTAQNSTNNSNLTYAWELIDLDKDAVILRKSGTLFSYTFNEKGKYNVKMNVTELSGDTDTDSKIIYINSRPPIAEFVNTIPFPNKPNKVFLDATKSYDPDISDDGKLKYSWIINGDRVNLEEPNFNGSTGYYTFDSIGDHSVVLEVEDPDNIISQKKLKVPVKSLLSVEFFIFPRVAQRTNSVRFVAESSQAKFYEWDFGDGNKKSGNNDTISHSYDKSGIFNVKLKVVDTNDNQNTFTKSVYIGDSDSPFSFITLLDSNRNNVIFEESACGEGAYILNRVDTVIFSGNESIDINGDNKGLTYSWKLGNQDFKNTGEFTKKFDDLGCFPIKLTVKSNSSGKTHSTTTYVEVRNLKPTLSSLDVSLVNDTTDPVIVNVSALGAKDRDGVVQSYLWYYYTDIDSEPQEYRATKSSNTSFVLPKVTGNYYFVVVMKDNNEERITSEEITGSKYFITLTGDNLNTPIIKLSVDNSSISVGEEVTFTANVENILGQDITNKVKYSWDFDGDGFYDKETTTGKTSHKYISSGEKHAKVKVKHKGFSNTKSVTLNVSNLLVPDFGYISIGNKFIFFNNSKGTTDSTEWNLGDGTIIKNSNSFIHEYKDNKVSHLVNLKITEGTKVKDINQKVVKNVKNIVTSRKNGLVIFSSPTINEKNEILLEKRDENVFVYLGASNGDIINYVIDNDIEIDSDLNGTNDDDEDNSQFTSYTSGGVINVVLNDNKTQKIRLYIKNSKNEVIDSKDITIIKSYIEDKIIDLNNIVFKGVSESIKLKIEKLKEHVNKLPKEHKLKAMMYVQKLQEDWFDNREKTNVILEFEGFIQDTKIENSEEIINLLESLLVDDQKDKSEKSIAFIALKNLIPQTIICKDIKTAIETNCYLDLVSKLEAIKDNENVDENKVLGTEILKAIAGDTVMTNKQKTDFKAILKTLIYGGLSNIPTNEIGPVEQETQNTSTSNFIDLLINILKWLFYIIIGFGLIIFIFYIYYLIVNKDKNIGFQDFIIDRTSGIKKSKIESKDDGLSDILNEIQNNEKIDNKTIETKPEIKVILKNTDIKQENKKDEVPDWLKGSFAEEVIPEIKPETKPETKSEIKQETKTEEIKQETKTETVPDWLKGSFNEVKTYEEPEIKSETKTEEINQETKSENVDEISNIETDNIPDWLKGNFNDVKTYEEPEIKQETKTEEIEQEIKSVNIDEISNIETDNIPDWLKGSFNEIKNVEETSKKQDDKIPDWLKGSFTDEVVSETIKEETKMEEVKLEKPKIEEKEETKKEEKKVEKKGEKSVNKKNIKKEVVVKKPDKKTDNIKNTDEIIEQDITNELWDDGMKIPDWLKSTGDDNEANTTK
ncbi:MAG: PKD domain-containing protein [Candidatus Gracilibacteria bacterium]|nr:PKD domain-containing protein [Candidatus Gracilibacteria bacterium]